MRRLFGSLVMVVVATIMTSCLNPAVATLNSVETDNWVEIGQVYAKNANDVFASESTGCEFEPEYFKIKCVGTKSLVPNYTLWFRDSENNKIETIQVCKIYIRKDMINNEVVLQRNYITNLESNLYMSNLNFGDYNVRISRDFLTREWSVTNYYYNDSYKQWALEFLANYN